MKAESASLEHFVRVLPAVLMCVIRQHSEQKPSGRFALAGVHNPRRGRIRYTMETQKVWICSAHEGFVRANNMMLGANGGWAYIKKGEPLLIEWLGARGSTVVSLCGEELRGDAMLYRYPGDVAVVEIFLPREEIRPRPAPHGYFNLPFISGGEEYVLRGYYDGGRVLSVERSRDLYLSYLAYTPLDLAHAHTYFVRRQEDVLAGVTAAGQSLVLRVGKSCGVVYSGGGELAGEADRLLLKRAAHGREQTTVFDAAGRVTHRFSPLKPPKTVQEAACALLVCAQYGLTADARALLCGEIVLAAGQLREFFGEFIGFAPPHFPVTAKENEICLALFYEVCQNIRKAKLLWFSAREENGEMRIENISD